MNASNRLAAFDQANTRLMDLTTHGVMTGPPDQTFDYGLILKTHPVQFPNRTWLMCAGFGEWGTSGASWYLANQWETIRKQVKSRPFAAVVRVRHGQDESAECIRIVI